jgi:AcrR family transcriptional regulator
MGLREDKKERTRAAISHLATKLFLERGYDEVTTAEIATLAGVSVPTLFKYFPTKEALVFDEDAEREQFLVDTVANRERSETILKALLNAGLRVLSEIENVHQADSKRFMKLIDNTPALSLYAQQMWLRHEKALGAAIRASSKKAMTGFESEAVSRFVLDAYHRSLRSDKPAFTLKALFKILEKGWRE